MEGGMVAVDRWSEGSQAYFLTHLHADHIRGLSSSWNRGPLFCSRTTAKLLPFKFPDFDVSLLRVVDIGSWYSLSLLSPSTGSPSKVEFMAIDALHCPGDFRWEAADEKAHVGRKKLLNALDGAKVDVLYLDNTYCNPSYSFPSREVAAQQVMDIITSHPDCDIIIGIDSLGKEDLLVHISRVLSIKICVWPERLQTLHLLGLPDIFTTKTSLTRVRAVPRYSFRIDTLEGLNSTLRATIGIMPSGLPWMGKSVEGKQSLFCSPSMNDGSRVNQCRRSVERVHQYIYSVPYSDHSCYSEIMEFVELLQPSNVKGIVSISSCYVDPIYHLRHLLSPRRPSQRSHLKLQSKEENGKSASKDLYGGKSMGLISKKRSPGDYLRVQISRLSVLRKAKRQQGSKIVEIDDCD